MTEGRQRRPTAERAPRAAARASSVPCHSGDAQVTGCTHSGSRSIGKNVPENSVIGISTSRNSTVNAEPSSCTPAVKAVTGAATAAPVSSATSSAVPTPAERTPPKAAITAT